MPTSAVHSMTAFARCQSVISERQLTWEMRSVNHRFLEVQIRLPDGLRHLEHPLRETLRKHLKRGKVDCTLRMDMPNVEGGLELNRKLLLQLLAVLEQVRRDAPELGPPNPIELLRWPGILGDEAEVDEDFLGSAISDLFEEGLTQLIAHRQREGEQLAATLNQRLDQIERIVTRVQEVASTLRQDIQDRLVNRLEELGTTLDSGRLEQEIALLAQRADIAEELDRLVIHVEEARACLRGSGPHGRRLDFLTQELNREANTLAAKSVIAETSQRAVDLKVVVEQIREQVQNVE